MVAYTELSGIQSTVGEIHMYIPEPMYSAHILKIAIFSLEKKERK